MVTDEKFNVITPSEDIVFNPDIPQEDWDFWAYRNLLKNSYPFKSLEKAKPFSCYYNKIKNLFKGEDVICIGFQINEDVKYLLANCDRYNLEPINFKYLDIREVILKLTGEKAESLGIEYVKYMHKPYYDAHKSSVDAEMTMCVLREVLKKYKVKLEDLIESDKSLVATINGFIYGFEGNLFDIKNPREPSHQYVSGRRLKRPKEGREDCIDKWTVNELLFTRFIQFVEPVYQDKQVLKDKKVCISLNYESVNYQNMLKLVQLISNAGGTYEKQSTLADIFVKQKEPLLDEEGNIKECSRLRNVIEAVAKNTRDIKVIEFDELLTLLGLTYEELNKMPNIDVEYLKDDKYKKKTI